MKQQISCNSTSSISFNNSDVSKTQKQIVLFIAVLAGFLTPFDGSAINIALPSIAHEFQMDAIHLTWISMAYLLSAAVFLVPFGKIADIYGRKKIFFYGIIVFTIASFLMTTVQSTFMLIVFRILQGLGSAMIFGTAIAMITSVFAPGERGKALGIYVTAVYIGLSMGPFLGGLLTQNFGWRSVFAVNIPIGIIVFLLIKLKLKNEWMECKDQKFDLIGSIVYSISLTVFMYGLSILPLKEGFYLLFIGVIGLIAFILYEIRNPFPVLDMKLFIRNKTFTFSNFAALINYSATFAVTFLLSLYLQYIKGFTPQYAGFILIVQPFVQAFLSPIAGKLSDKITPRIIATAGMIFTVIGLFLLSLISETTSISYLIIILIILGTGFGLFSSPNTNIIMSAVDKKYYGVASGMHGTMRLLGQMFSMGIAMMLLAVYIGPVQISPAYYPQFIETLHTAFIIFTILCIIGIFASFKRDNV